MKFGMTVLIASLMLSLSCFAQNEAKEKAALQAAMQWLAEVDSGNYTQSWQDSAPAFKVIVTQQKWEDILKAKREPLGRVLSRNLASAEYTTKLPGISEGEYVVLKFNTNFENKKQAVETVTPMVVKGGQWKVSSYFIR